jgi:hypothetical protein
LYTFLKEGNESGLSGRVERTKQMARAFYKDYNATTDHKVAKAMFKLFAKEVKPEFQPALFQRIKSDYNGNIDLYIDKMFETQPAFGSS